MKILKDTMLEKKIKLTEADIKDALISYINAQFPDLITDEDFMGLDNNLVASFKYEPK